MRPALFKKLGISQTLLFTILKMLSLLSIIPLAQILPAIQEIVQIQEVRPLPAQLDNIQQFSIK